MQPHVMAVPVLDRGGAADRLRNHLRRRAITRLGLIEGDPYFLPYWRVRGAGPEGETSLHILAAEVGDARLYRASLPPADLKPFEPEAIPPGALLLTATLAEAGVRARAESIGWRADALEELIAYPFWLMRVEDSGRIEGAWIDGVEGGVIHHTLKVPPPVPTVKRSALMLAAPASLMGAASLVWGERFELAASAAVVVACLTALALGWILEKEGRREREG